MSLATLEVDAELVFRALDEKRQREHMTVRAVERTLGAVHPAYTWWSRGGGMTADFLIRACTWLDRHPREFARDPAEQPEAIP
jgi:hypothetical protein